MIKKILLSWQAYNNLLFSILLKRNLLPMQPLHQVIPRENVIEFKIPTDTPK